MPTKRLASRWHSHDDPSSDDSSSQGDDQFAIAPCPRRETRKSTHRGEACSSQADEEATNRAEGHAIHEAREAKERVEIQKVDCPLRPGYEYTLRRVDRRHPHRPTDFTLGDKLFMVNCNENPFDWTTELHDHHFWNNFWVDWYLTVIKEWKNPITPQQYVDWTYM
jgi:hypothetical protein